MCNKQNLIGLLNPHIARVAFIAIVVAFFYSPVLHAQSVNDWGENTDPFRPPKTGWIADSLFIGATFLRDTTKDSFTIWLHRNEAGCVGRLYLMVPGGGSGGRDTAIYLFQNKNNSGPTRMNLTNNALINSRIHHLDTLFFRYKVVPGYQCDTFILSVCTWM